MGYKANGRGQGWARGIVKAFCHLGHPKEAGRCLECRRDTNARYYRKLAAKRILATAKAASKSMTYLDELNRIAGPGCFVSGPRLPARLPKRGPWPSIYHELAGPVLGRVRFWEQPSHD